MSVRYFYLIAVAAALGCATQTAGTPGARRSSNVITEEEIAKAGVTNAYEAIERLRPNFLRSRGPASLSTAGARSPTVYLGSQRYGDITTLRTIPVSQVGEIRYYNASEATTRFGMDNTYGVIEITVRGT